LVIIQLLVNTHTYAHIKTERYRCPNVRTYNSPSSARQARDSISADNNRDMRTRMQRDKERQDLPRKLRAA
jgi:hypothetical protein